MSYIDSSLYQTDPQLAKLLEGEFERQTTTLQMIPSENYASKAVLQTMGSVLTNKYAEGYPGKRYYNGCGYYDMIENLAIERAKNLFKAEHVNVQLHTGTQSNLAAYYAFIEPGDVVMAMRVDQGGHLTHGKKENFSGKLYNFHFYGVSEKDHRIDYAEVMRLARKAKPKLIVAGASAYPRIIEFGKFREIADEVGAFLMTDIAHIVGLVAAKLHPDPVPVADVVTTTTHKTLRGPRGAIILTKKKYAEAIDRAVFPGVQAGPLMHQIAAKAVCFQEAKSFGFKEYQKQILLNAAALAETLLSEGFNLITGGTDNHLMMVDLTDTGLSGREAADLLEEAGIVVNFNSIPYDKKPPMVTSGIRPGTPALTTRGMKEEEMQVIGKMFSRVLKNPGDERMRVTIAGEVRELCDQFPIYRDLLQW